MKANSKDISLFTFREIIACLTEKNGPLAEGDICNHVLQEMFKSNITDNMEKTNLDYTTLYKTFDLFDAFSFLGRRTEPATVQRSLIWQGFKGLKEKFWPILSKRINNKPYRAGNKQRGPPCERGLAEELELP